jgi:hemin uptake protein HemP
MGTKFRGIKTAAEYERGEFAKDVLRLIGAGVVVGTSVVAPNTLQVLDYFRPNNRVERNKIWNTIKYLERKGHVAIHEHNGQEYLYLTREGKVKFDEERIWELTLANPSRWDHKWRIVMFDFPNTCKSRSVNRNGTRS